MNYINDSFEFEGLRAQFLPLPSILRKDPMSLMQDHVQATLSNTSYHLPPEFVNLPPRTEITYDSECCRLDDYEYSAGEKILRLRFSKTKYGDYFAISDYLDDPLPWEHSRSFRDEFGQLNRDGNNVRPFKKLSNICGAGAFVVTQDGYVLVRRVPKTHVYPGRWTFSASGVMQWGAKVDPFLDIVRWCGTKINHQVDPKSLEMVEFGIDARKLFFQFCFVEWSNVTGAELWRRATSPDEQFQPPSEKDLQLLPLNPKNLIDHLFIGSWEPAAEVTLLALCRNHLARRISEYSRHFGRREIADEFDGRSHWPGDLPNMSPRYQRDMLDKASKEYIARISTVMQGAIKDKKVLEIGCGTGRLTAHLARTAKKVVSIDLCERMIELAKKNIGQTPNVEFFCEFAQDFLAKGEQFDVIVCSLVLIHNYRVDDFQRLVNGICRSAKIAFAFEDVSERDTGPFTKLRSRYELIAAFDQSGFQSKIQDEYRLFDDKIAILRFEPKGLPGQFIFRLDGTQWFIHYQDEKGHFKDSKGLQDIHRLLEAGKAISAMELMGPEGSRALSSDAGGEILDNQARRSFENELEKLKHEMDDTVNPEKKAELLDEYESIRNELRKVQGLHGRSRSHQKTPIDKAADAVRKRIETSLGKIAESMPNCSKHLLAQISFGQLCEYNASGVIWALS